MKRFILSILAVPMIFGFAAGAHALTFTLESYGVTLNTQDPGLVLYWQDNPVARDQPYRFDLEVGQSVVIPLFTLETLETYVNADDVLPKEILVAFDFSMPEVSADVDGWSRGRWLHQDGVIRWNGPVGFRFGDTGMFTVAIEDVHLRGIPGSELVNARFTYVHEGSARAQVPESATVLLLGMGLIGLSILRRLL